MSETISKLSLPPLTYLLITDLESLKTHSDTDDRRWTRSMPKIALVAVSSGRTPQRCLSQDADTHADHCSDNHRPGEAGDR
jgi:hypothetical protein